VALPKAAGCDELAIVEDRRYCVMDRHHRKSFALATEERIAAADYEASHSKLRRACEYRIEVAFSASVQDMEPHRAGRRMRQS